MPSWHDGLVDAFPIPIDKLSLEEVDDDEHTTRSFAHDQFRFLALPSELRNRVYKLILFSKREYRRKNGRRKGKRLAVMQVSKRLHAEAAYILYTTQDFLIFSLQDFLFYPNVRELPRHYQKLVTNLRLKVGSSWTNPPKDWRVTGDVAKCLAGLDSVQTLKIFIETDPSHPVFEGYRISVDFYTNFCGELVRDILTVMPQLKFVQLDGNFPVRRSGPLASRLVKEVEQTRKMLKWGMESNWAHDTLA